MMELQWLFSHVEKSSGERQRDLQDASFQRAETSQKKKTSWYKEAMKDIKKPTTTDEEKKEQQKQHLSSLPKMTFDKLERI